MQPVLHPFFFVWVLRQPVGREVFQCRNCQRRRAVALPVQQEAYPRLGLAVVCRMILVRERLCRMAGWLAPEEQSPGLPVPLPVLGLREDWLLAAAGPGQRLVVSAAAQRIVAAVV